MDDNYLFFFNVIALIVLFILFIILIFKNIRMQTAVANLDYVVFKPLFPFELKNDDPYKITMHHKEEGGVDAEISITSNTKFL